MKLYGPFDVSLEVYVTNGDDVAKITYQMPRDEEPTVGAMRRVASSVEEQIQKKMGDDWMLCTKREYLDTLVAETTGQNVQFAMPGGDEWDEPER